MKRLAPDLSRSDRFFGWARRLAHVTQRLTWGLIICIISGGGLVPRLPPGASHTLLLVALPIILVWCLFAVMVQLWTDIADFPQQYRRWSRKDGWTILLLAILVFSFTQRESSWAVLVGCFCFFAAIWLRSTPAQRRWPISAAGWLWGGIYPLMLAWPNPDRFDLGLLIGGAATALEGIVEIFRALPRSPGNRLTPDLS